VPVSQHQGAPLEKGTRVAERGQAKGVLAQSNPNQHPQSEIRSTKENEGIFVPAARSNPKGDRSAGKGESGAGGVPGNRWQQNTGGKSERGTRSDKEGYLPRGQRGRGEREPTSDVAGPQASNPAEDGARFPGAHGRARADNAGQRRYPASCGTARGPREGAPTEITGAGPIRAQAPPGGRGGLDAPSGNGASRNAETRSKGVPATQTNQAEDSRGIKAPSGGTAGQGGQPIGQRARNLGSRDPSGDWAPFPQGPRGMRPLSSLP
jgi:hypothetical protein